MFLEHFHEHFSMLSRTLQVIPTLITGTLHFHTSSPYRGEFADRSFKTFLKNHFHRLFAAHTRKESPFPDYTRRLRILRVNRWQAFCDYFPNLHTSAPAPARKKYIFPGQKRNVHKCTTAPRYQRSRARNSI